MATRFYAPSTGSPAINPAYSASWGVTTNAVRRPLPAYPTNTALATDTSGSFAETSASAINVLHAQFTSPPLAAQTISGTFSAVFPCTESSTSADAYLQVIIRLVNGSTGADLGKVLYAGDAAAVTSTSGAATQEAPTTIATRIKNGLSLTSQTSSAGDRLVIEVGVRFTNISASSFSGSVRFGDLKADPDYALSAGTATIASLPWVQLSGDISWQLITPLSTDVVAGGVTFDEYVHSPVNNAVSTSIVEGVYRMPAGSVGLCFVSSNAGASEVITTTLADAGGAWTKIIEQNFSTGQPGCVAAFRKAFAGQTDITLTASTLSSAIGHSFKLYAIKSGYNTAQPVGATSAQNTTLATWTSAAVTPQRSGVLFSAIGDWTAAGIATSSDLTEESWWTSGFYAGAAGYKADSAGVSTTVSWAMPAASDQINAVIVEIRSPSGITTPQAVAGTGTSTGGLAKQVAKPSVAHGTAASTGAATKQLQRRLSGTGTSTGVLAPLRSVPRSLGGTVTSIGSPAKQVGKKPAGTAGSAGALASARTTFSALAGAITSAASLARRASKAFAATGTSAGSVAAYRTVARALAGAVGSTGGLARRAGKAVAGTVASLIGGLARQDRTTFGGSASLTGDAAKRAAKPAAGVGTPVGTTSLRTGKSFAGTANTSGDASRQTQRALAGADAPTGGLLALRFVLRSVAGVAGPVGDLARTTSKDLAAACSSASTATRMLVRGLAGATTPTGAFSGLRAFVRAMAGTVSSAAEITRRPGKALDSAAGSTGDLTRSGRKSLGAATTPAGALVASRTVFQVLAGTVVSAGAAVRRLLRSFAGDSTPLAEISRRLDRSFTGGGQPTGLLDAGRLVRAAFASAIPATGSLTRQVGKLSLSLLVPFGAAVKLAAKSFAGLLAPAGDLTPVYEPFQRPPTVLPPLLTAVAPSLSAVSIGAPLPVATVVLASPIVETAVVPVPALAPVTLLAPVGDPETAVLEPGWTIVPPT